HRPALQAGTRSRWQVSMRTQTARWRQETLRKRRNASRWVVLIAPRAPPDWQSQQPILSTRMQSTSAVQRWISSGMAFRSRWILSSSWEMTARPSRPAESKSATIVAPRQLRFFVTFAPPRETAVAICLCLQRPAALVDQGGCELVPPGTEGVDAG